MLNEEEGTVFVHETDDTLFFLQFVVVRLLDLTKSILNSTKLNGQHIYCYL